MLPRKHFPPGGARRAPTAYVRAGVAAPRAGWYPPNSFSYEALLFGHLAKRTFSWGVTPGLWASLDGCTHANRYKGDKLKRFVRFAAVLGPLGLYTASFPAGAANGQEAQWATGCTSGIVDQNPQACFRGQSSCTWGARHDAVRQFGGWIYVEVHIVGSCDSSVTDMWAAASYISPSLTTPLSTSRCFEKVSGSCTRVEAFASGHLLAPYPNYCFTSVAAAHFGYNSYDPGGQETVTLCA